jgi:hypothetical protein
MHLDAIARLAEESLSRSSRITMHELEKDVTADRADFGSF